MIACTVPGPSPAAGRGGRRGGFTLVELLVVMAIMAMLAAMVLGALNAARHATNITRTRSLVVRLNQAVMGKWDNYRTRRIPLAFSPTQKIPARAAGRLQAMWDLQRLEFPQSLMLDVALPQYAVPMKPAVAGAYAARLKTAGVITGPDSAGKYTVVNDKNEMAECLYLICQIGLGAEGTAAAEIGKSMTRDADRDGMPEFVDAWGNPLDFFRWPAGLVSEVMPLRGDGSAAPYRDPIGDPDPLDFARVAVPSTAGEWKYGYRVVPLINSWGPDGERGLFSADAGAATSTSTLTSSAGGTFTVQGYLNPWYVPSSPSPAPYAKGWELGQVGGRKSGVGEAWTDNISSHQPGSR